MGTRVICAGCDPGLSGALATYDSEERAPYIQDLPTLTITKGSKGRGRTVLDLPQLRGVFNLLALAERPDIFVLEQVGGFPHDTPARAFSFGEVYGTLKTLAFTTLPCRVVNAPSQEWKRRMGVKGEKDDSIRRADELFPAYTHLWRGPRGGVLHAGDHNDLDLRGEGPDPLERVEAAEPRHHEIEHDRTRPRLSDGARHRVDPAPRGGAAA